MKFITTELREKVENGTATEDERIVFEILIAVSDVTPEEAVQIITQAEAVLDARDRGEPDIARALLELFSSGHAIARRGPDGYEFRLTALGMAHAATIVRRMAKKMN